MQYELSKFVLLLHTYFEAKLLHYFVKYHSSKIFVYHAISNHVTVIISGNLISQIEIKSVFWFDSTFLDHDA